MLGGRRGRTPSVADERKNALRRWPLRLTHLSACRPFRCGTEEVEVDEQAAPLGGAASDGSTTLQGAVAAECRLEWSLEQLSEPFLYRRLRRVIHRNGFYRVLSHSRPQRARKKCSNGAATPPERGQAERETTLLDRLRCQQCVSSSIRTKWDGAGPKGYRPRDEEPLLGLSISYSRTQRDSEGPSGKGRKRFRSPLLCPLSYGR